MKATKEFIQMLPEFKELRDILSTMEIPNKRFVDFDIEWIFRNLGVRNRGHEKFGRAIVLLKFLYDKLVDMPNPLPQEVVDENRNSTWYSDWLRSEENRNG